MAITKEYRIILPITVDEYQVAQLYSVAESSKHETGGGEGVEVIKNSPYEEGIEADKHSMGRKGQYTHKLYHLDSKVPYFIRMIAPEGSLVLKEEAWNAYPYCKTVITNPGYMKDNMKIELKTWHKKGAGLENNVHELDNWKSVEVVQIDIANDKVSNADYRKETDPKLYIHEESGREGLGENWLQAVQQKCKIIQEQRSVDIDEPAVMTCYKLVTVEFKWFGLQNRVENYIQGAQKRLITIFHRQLYCWMGPHKSINDTEGRGWYGIDMNAIRQMEAETASVLEKERTSGALRGHSEANEE